MNLTIPEEFPISEKERQLIKKKLLMFLAWCDLEKCKTCPVFCISPELSNAEDKVFRLFRWIMEAEI